MLYVYIENLLVITKYYFTYHMKAIEKVLQKLAEEGLKLNA